MSVIKDMKTYLISKGVSVPIYLGSVPDKDADCIGLYRYAGKPVLKEAGIERVGMQVKCRAKDYEEACANANLLCALLNMIGDEDVCGDVLDIDGTKYIRVYPLQSAVCTESDEMCEMVQNFLVSVIV